MVASTWETRERPILEAVLRLEEAGSFPISTEAVAQEVGLEIPVVGPALQTLVDSSFAIADGGDGGGFAEAYPMPSGVRLLERGRREVGQWPPSVAEAFLDRLDALIAAAEPDERGRLERLKSAAADVSKGAIAGAIVAAGQWGIGG